MTVCQFFVQGRCRFGQNCKFEHSYNNDDRNSRNPVNSQHLNNVVKQIVEEVIIAEEGGQWPLSCFSPIKGGPNIPGWEDVSPEEVRWKMYEARTNGTLNQCNLEINHLYSNAEKMRNFLKESNAERVNLIVNALNSKKEPTNSSTQFTNSSSSTNIFGGSAQCSDTQKIFRSATSNAGNQGNIFGSSAPSSGNIFSNSNQSSGIIFGSSAGFSNQNIFGNSSASNTFSRNAFLTPQTNNQNMFSNSSSLGNGNIFTNATVSNQSLFSKAGEANNQNISNAFLPASSSGVFSNPVSSNAKFGSNTTFFSTTENLIQNQSNIFGTSSKKNIFNNSIIFTTQSEPNRIVLGGENQNNFNSNSNSQLTSKQYDSSVYSKLEDLSEEEIKSFASPTFVFGKIPLKPPLKEYCK